jgi:tRNA(Ile)-lysidine synthase
MSSPAGREPGPQETRLPFLDRIRETIRRHGMLIGGETVVVAVSGGPDSTALVHAMTALAREMRWSLQVAHLDHGLRREAADDAAFVATMSQALGLEYRAESADARSRATREGLSVEDAARRLRYEFLTRIAKDVGATAIATGHTLDDQAETVLLRLLRGSGLDGLAGIPPVRQSDGIRVVRPLLEVTRDEVLAYLNEIGAGWREDSTNQNREILRNRIRLVLLPALEGYNRDVRRTLARVAALLRDEAEVLRSLAAPGIAETLSGDSGSVRVSRASFARLPAALQRRALRAAVERVRGNLRGVRFVHIEGARQLVLDGEVGAWLPLPGGVRVTRVSEGAEVAVGVPARTPSLYRLSVPGDVVALDFGLHVSADTVAGDRLHAEVMQNHMPLTTLMMDADVISGGLVIRGPKPGDRFAPLGMGGRTKAIADYLRDEGVPRHRRPLTPILATAEDVIVWVVGMRASEIGRISGATKRAVRIVARPLRA